MNNLNESELINVEPSENTSPKESATKNKKIDIER